MRPLHARALHRAESQAILYGSPSDHRRHCYLTIPEVLVKDYITWAVAYPNPSSFGIYRYYLQPNLPALVRATTPRTRALDNPNTSQVLVVNAERGRRTATFLLYSVETEYP